MTVLSYQTIKAQCAGATPLVDPTVDGSFRSAGYDLRLGQEYYISNSPTRFGRVRVNRFEGLSGTLEIRSNEIAVVQTLESVSMPLDLVGHISLKLNLLLQGIIMASQSQIDAGYNGPIYALFYNLSDKPVTMSVGDPILRLEFDRLDKKTEHKYSGAFVNSNHVSDVVRHRLVSSLEGLERKVTRLRLIAVGAAAALLISLAGIGFALLGPLQHEASDASSNANASSTAVMSLQQRLAKDEIQLNRLEGIFAEERGEPGRR